MMKRKIGVQGASGRSGSYVLSVIGEFPEFELGAAVVSPGSTLLGTKCTGSQIAFTAHSEVLVKSCDAWIDFSNAQASLTLARSCAAAKKPLLIASTGHTEVERAELQKLALSTALLLAPNTSLGIFALHQLVGSAREILGQDYDVEIMEIHHRHKKDAPSGTALSLAREVAQHSDLNILHERATQTQARSSDQLGIASVRGGDVYGEHTVYFLGDGERLELTHRVSNRAVYGRGALCLMKKLIDRTAGLYSIKDLFLGS